MINHEEHIGIEVCSNLMYYGKWMHLEDAF